MNPLAFLLTLAASSPVQAVAVPPPPTYLTIIACRVDDLTGQPGRHNPAMAAKNWRDLEWRRDAENRLSCKRVILKVEDAAQYGPTVARDLPHDFSKVSQCAKAALMIGPFWADENRGWFPLKVGCPTPMWSDNGTPDDRSDDYIVGYKMPECPTTEPGTDFPMKCDFDESEV